MNGFFDGVSARINAGVKEAEISYQLQFSKQELKKVVHAYPGKEQEQEQADASFQGAWRTLERVVLKL